MIIIGVDYHPSFQQIAFLDQQTGECGERRLNHSASRSLKREFEEVIMVEVLIEEMYGSD
jgi:hypothetical protein